MSNRVTAGLVLLLTAAGAGGAFAADFEWIETARVFRPILPGVVVSSYGKGRVVDSSSALEACSCRRIAARSEK